MKPLVSVEIDIGDFGTIDTVTASDYAENSAFKGGNYDGSAISYKKSDLDPFILDHSELDNGREYTDIYNGLVSNCVTLDRYMEDFYNKGVSGYLVNNYDSTLYYDYGYKITIKGKNIKSFTVEFDKSVGYYPTYMMLGSQSVYMNDDYTFTHLVDSSSSGGQEYKLVIILMSKPNVPVVIKSITIDDVQTFSSQNSLISFKRGSQSVQDFTLPSYGVVSNYGSISFIDTPSKQIYNLINNGYMDTELDVRLFIDGNVVGTYKTNNDWNYNTYSNVVTVTFDGYIEKLQNSYLHCIAKSRNAFELLQEIISKIPNSFEFDYSDCEDYLKTISMPFSYLSNDTCWQQLNKIANIAQLYVYNDNNGVIKITKHK